MSTESGPKILSISLKGPTRRIVINVEVTDEEYETYCKAENEGDAAVFCLTTAYGLLHRFVEGIEE